MPETTNIIDMECTDVWKLLVDYMEGDMTPELYRRVYAHLKACTHCTAVYDGVRNVVVLMGDETALELPEGFSQRLYKHFAARP